MHFNILLIQRETDGKFKMGARATSRHLEGAFRWYILRAGGIRGQGGGGLGMSLDTWTSSHEKRHNTKECDQVSMTSLGSLVCHHYV